MKINFDSDTGAYYNKSLTKLKKLDNNKNFVTFKKNSLKTFLEKKFNETSDIDFIKKVLSLTVIGMGLALIFSIFYNQKKFNEAEKAATEIINKTRSTGCQKSRTLDVIK